MTNRNQRKVTVADRFARMLSKSEKLGALQSERVKVEAAERIYLEMERQGINNAELARRLKKSRAYITKVLEGNENFTIETLCQIAKALGCRLEPPKFVPISEQKSGVKIVSSHGRHKDRHKEMSWLECLKISPALEHLITGPVKDLSSPEWQRKSLLKPVVRKEVINYETFTNAA